RVWCVHASSHAPVHPRELLLRGAQFLFGRLAVGDVEIDAVVAKRGSVLVADHASAAEDPPLIAVGTNDPVLDFVRVAATLEGLAKAVDNAVAVGRMAERAHGFDRNAVAGGREAHDAEELRGSPHAVRREVDAPDAHPSRLLG